MSGEPKIDLGFTFLFIALACVIFGSFPLLAIISVIIGTILLNMAYHDE